MRSVTSPSQFAALTQDTGVELSLSGCVRAYKAYGELLRMIARVHEPLPAETVAAHRFDAGES